MLIFPSLVMSIRTLSTPAARAARMARVMSDCRNVDGARAMAVAGRSAYRRLERAAVVGHRVLPPFSGCGLRVRFLVQLDVAVRIPPHDEEATAVGVAVVDEGAAYEIEIAAHLKRQRVLGLLVEHVEIVTASNSTSAVARHAVWDREAHLLDRRRPLVAVLAVEIFLELQGLVFGEQLVNKALGIGGEAIGRIVIFDELRIVAPFCRRVLSKPLEGELSTAAKF